MIRRPGLASCLLVTFLWSMTPSTAQAAGRELGSDGQFIISGNRLVTIVGYESAKTSTTTNGVTSSQTNTQWTVAASALGPFGVAFFFTIPRLGADYVVASHVTVGLDLLAWTTVSRGRDVTIGSTTNSQNSAKASLLGAAPRVGYVLSFTDSVAFWPRLGVSFAQVFVGGSDTTVNQFAVEVEPLFALSPAPHFSITLGPVFDIPITGTQSGSATNPLTGATTTTSTDAAQFYGGLTLGLLGWF
jgi:hypothetical protein